MLAAAVSLTSHAQHFCTNAESSVWIPNCGAQPDQPVCLPILPQSVSFSNLSGFTVSAQCQQSAQPAHHRPHYWKQELRKTVQFLASGRLCALQTERKTTQGAGSQNKALLCPYGDILEILASKIFLHWIRNILESAIKFTGIFQEHCPISRFETIHWFVILNQQPYSKNSDGNFTTITSNLRLVECILEKPKPHAATPHRPPEPGLDSGGQVSVWRTVWSM